MTPPPAGAPSGAPVAVVGAGWAGLAAAVALVQAGRPVTLFEMAAAPGGRARQLPAAQGEFDNGQHILIGAYTQTLDLMRLVGADPDHLLLRQPLALRYPDGGGLQLPPGPALPAFVRAVLAARGWRLADKLALLAAAAAWMARGFDCPEHLTVHVLCNALPVRVRDDLVDPLCVAALNTPASSASARVFLRVLKDALFAGPGSADLLLPQAGLSALLPEPALRWLRAAGAGFEARHRVQHLAPGAPGQAGWSVDGQRFSSVVLACSAVEAARLAAPHQAPWARAARQLRHEPIVTAYLADPGLRLPQAMVALRGQGQAPAQFVFDLGRLGRHPACFAWVVSGAGDHLRLGLADCGLRVLAQARQVFPGAFLGDADQVIRHLVAERRATFACVPGLDRPGTCVAPGLVAAGDYIAGPYPSTLEGAVRSGQAAARALLA